MTNLGLVPDEPFVNGVGGFSLALALSEFTDAATEYLKPFFGVFSWTDASTDAHADCAHRRFLTAGLWLFCELKRRGGVMTPIDANYDDATVAELLGGMQG
ncbi:hypothetical protein [Mycobacterium sp. HM-7]